MSGLAFKIYKWPNSFANSILAPMTPNAVSSGPNNFQSYGALT
jgi:hypothetical protein